MITTEDRARAAMRAIGDTVRDAPPLELPPGARISRPPPMRCSSAVTARAASACAAPAARPVPAAAAGTADGGPSSLRSPPRSQSRPSPSRW